MTQTEWTDADTARAKQIWEQYQAEHDLTGLRGRAAGIDPISGRVWLGRNAVDIVRQRAIEGLSSPLYFVRVGFDHYTRKVTPPRRVRTERV